MFKDLEKKIKIILLMAIFAWISLTCITVYATIRKSIYENYIHMSMQYVSQQNQNVHLYMKLMEETSKLVTENEVILSCLTDTAFNNKIVPLLDNIMSSNTYILGITVYGENKSLYLSSNVYQVSSLETVRNLIPDGQSISGKTTGYWKIRHSDIPKFFAYNSSQDGVVLTYIINIRDHRDKSVGFILLDTNIMTVYNFFKPSTAIFFDVSNTYILSEDHSILPSPHNTKRLSLNSETIANAQNTENQYFLTKDNKQILFNNPLPGSRDAIVVSIPFNINSHLRHLAVLMGTVASAFILFCFLTTKILTISIIKPLRILYTKMQKSIS